METTQKVAKALRYAGFKATASANSDIVGRKIGYKLNNGLKTFYAGMDFYSQD